MPTWILCRGGWLVKWIVLSAVKVLKQVVSVGFDAILNGDYAFDTDGRG